MRRIPSVLLVSAAILSMAGCRDSAPTNKVLGAARFVELRNDEGAVAVTATHVAFNPTLLGSEVRREIIVRNEGRASFTVDSVVAASGTSDAFRFDATSFQVRPDEQVIRTVVFLPTLAGHHAGALQFNVTGGEPSQLVAELSGDGVNGGCSLTAERLEFGAVAVGTSVPRQLAVLNPSTLAWDVNIGDVEQSGNGAFDFGAGFAAGIHTVPAAGADGTPGQLIIPVEFAPDHLGEYEATVAILDPSMCPSRITLHARAVATLLECAPQVEQNGTPVCHVDFGFVSPGSSATRQVQFTNVGEQDVVVTVVSIDQPLNDTAPFAVVGEQREFTVPARGGTTSIDLEFKPGKLGDQYGRLHYSSSDSSHPSGVVDLFGAGGGPKISVEPAQVEFGRTALQTAPSRRVLIANVGEDDPRRDDDNLLLGTSATVTGTDAAEFSIVWPPTGYPEHGLIKNGYVEVTVHFAPTTVGRKNATVEIYSNDTATPVATVSLSGLGVDLPPCDYEVRPPALEFGAVSPNSFLALGFTIVNLAHNAADECIISSLDVTDDTARRGAFALVNGPIDNVSIKGGESLTVPVRFAPKTDGDYTGEVQFYVSNPLRPNGSVPLHGVAQGGCLLITPRDLAFWTIGIGCNSRPRKVTVYNTCSNSVTLTAIGVVQTASTRFTLTDRPPLPKTLPGGEYVELGVTYHPDVAGTDSGMLSITASTSPNPYIVSLTGEGAASAVQTEVFSQGEQPRIDVLFIVDNSGSMSNKQNSLARNFASFMHYAIEQKVDYHVAVTSTDVSSSGENGRFVPLGTASPRVITPATPNKEDVFAANVRLGTNGSGTESLIRPAYLALTSPLIGSHNAGFYRDEARLAVVVVSDAADQDPKSTPVPIYESFLLGLKGPRRRNDVTFSGIIPTMQVEPPSSSGCDYDESDSGQDPRVKQLVSETAGLVGEICDPDWVKTLMALGQRIFTVRTTFFLANVPDLSVTPKPIDVKIDGQDYPQYGSKGEKRWDYDSALNAIVFDTLAAPEPGATLSISYHVACLH